MKTFFANNWRPYSGFLGAKAGVSAAVPTASVAPVAVQFSQPTSYIYPPYGYVYPNGYTYPGVYEVSTPPAAPAAAPSALPYVIGGAVLLGAAALIAMAAKK